MHIIKLTLALVGVTLVSGCLDTDGERALAGAAGGAILSDAFGGSVATGAIAGAAAGALCDDAGVCN
ncbi:MAG: hypothetical protein AAF841_10460 [Pseudomonadota bacterium]